MAFYRGDHCAKRVAISNTGCVDFTGTGNNAGSFRILRNGHSSQDDEQLERRVLDATGDEQTDATPLDAGPGPLVDDDDNPYGHGKLATLWGIEYKWWQPTPGVTFGIPLHEWDDHIHILNVNGTTLLSDIGGKSSSSLTTFKKRDLEKRLDREWCVRVVKQCVESTAYPVAHGIVRYFAQGYRAAAAAVPQRHEVGSSGRVAYLRAHSPLLTKCSRRSTTICTLTRTQWASSSP